MYERLERQPGSSSLASTVSHHHKRYSARHRVIFYCLLFSLLLTGWLLLRTWSSHKELNQLNERLSHLATYLHDSRMALEQAKDTNTELESVVLNLRKSLKEQQSFVNEKDAVVASLRAQLEQQTTELSSKQQLENELGNVQYQLQRLREEREQLTEHLSSQEKQLKLCRTNMNAAGGSAAGAVLQTNVDAGRHRIAGADAALGQHLIEQSRLNPLDSSNSSVALYPEEQQLRFPPGLKPNLSGRAHVGVASNPDATAAELKRAKDEGEKQNRQIDAPVAAGGDNNNSSNAHNEDGTAGDMSAGDTDADRRVLIPPPRGVAVK